MPLWLSILLAILAIVICGCCIYLVVRKVENIAAIKEEKVMLEDHIILLQKDLQINKEKLQKISIQKKTLIENIEDLTKIQQQTEEQLKANVLKGFETYCDLLENNLKEKEEEYQDAAARLQEAYNLAQSKILTAINAENEELQKVRDTRAAAIEAQKREQEIKEKLSFYCLQPTQAELSDIKKLEEIKPQLNNPRILSMLIWSTYFQKPMTTLCNNVLGINTICGIYKITNQLNNMCYIGQATDVATRWKTHAKCGLGIDTPVGNKLYKAMIQDGLWNFSFELLEKCSKELLNEKEKYYIDLYSSKAFGYNTLKGIGD